MGYIKDDQHFVNYINKTIKMANGLDYKELLEAESYIDFVYNKGLQDRYCWEIKQDPSLLENENLLAWLKKQTGIGCFSVPSGLEHRLTAEFVSVLKDLAGVPGVYSFWTKKETPLYIGMSISLQSRVMQSFGERFNKYKQPVYFKYISTESASDAAVLEVYLICKFKPTLNGASKYNDILTMSFTDEISMSHPILCNRVKDK